MPNSQARSSVSLKPVSESEAVALTMRLLIPETLEYLPDHWRPVTSESEAVAWLTDQAADLFNIMHEQKTAGLMLVHKDANEWHVGFILLPEFWGRGVASAALKALQQLAMQEEKSITLLAGAASDNIASIKVLEKCGFEITRDDRQASAVWRS